MVPLMTSPKLYVDRDALGEPIDETHRFAPKFSADGLIPVATTDVKDNRLLMLAYMNEEALTKSIETGQAWYWSRSRQTLWRKGETSGNTQSIVELRIDCDQDAIELVVEQKGPACHTGRQGCFYRVVKSDADSAELDFNEARPK